MIKVLILKSWQYPPLFRQTPQGKGVWDGIEYTTDINSEYDYVLSLDSTKSDLELFTYRENIWKIIQEPPNEYFRSAAISEKIYSRIFTTNANLKSDCVEHNQPAIPWFVNKSYDSLKKQALTQKSASLSCITSNKTVFSGHKKRLLFIDKLKKEINFDLIGTFDYYHRQNPKISFSEFKAQQLRLGFTKVVKEKWQSLAPYRYSLVIENFQGPDYWSEKLADCFLARTMPIYYGCTNISEYFPEKSLVRININDKNSINIIKETVNSDLWLNNKKSIEEARNLVLEKYQFFPFFTGLIKEWDKEHKKTEKEAVIIPREDTYYQRIKTAINAKLNKLGDRLSGN